MSGLSKGSVDCSLIVPPKFSGKYINSSFDHDENDCHLRDVGLIRAVTIVKNFPVGG